MTRKTVYSRPLTPAQTQTQSIPLRQAPANSPQRYQDYDRVESLNPTRREKRSLPNEPQRYSTRDKAGGVGSSDHRGLHPLDTFTGGRESTPDSFSPDYTVTPSRSSVTLSPSSTHQDPVRKRARTETNPEHSFVLVDEGRSNKYDLADLLNPSSEDIAIYSPPPKREEPEVLRPLVEYVNPGSSHDIATPTSAGDSDRATSRSSSFAAIQPRPIGRHGMLGIDEDGQPLGSDGRVKKKGRKKPFESDQRRAEVLEVREIGACLRCHIMRIGCHPTKDEACPKCRETLPTSRKWTVPCTRKWLRERWQHLTPDILKEWNNPGKILPTASSGQIGESFLLPLTHVSNFTFLLKVHEVERDSLPSAALVHHFTDQKGEDANASIILSQNPCPPLVPDLLPGSERYRDTILQTSKLLEAQLKEISKTWINQVFRWEESEAWPRDVLQMVIHFQRDVARCPALDAGLKSCLLRFLMNHAFYIPFNRMPEVNNILSEDNRLPWNQLQEMRQREDIWSPTIVNQWLKSALLRMLEQHLGKLFKELELLFKLQENGGDQAKLSELDRDEAFCTIVVTFIVIGTMQTKLLYAAQARDINAKCLEGKTAREAKRCIQIMEDEVVDHILQLWKYRFSSQEMKGSPSIDKQETARKAKEFRFIYWFEDLKNNNEEKLMGIEPKLDLSDAKIKSFLTHNVSRLLLRLSLALWRPKSR